MMERLPRWFGNFTRLCCAQEIVLEVTFCKVSAFFIHFKMVLIIIQLLYKKKGENGIKVWKMTFFIMPLAVLEKIPL